MRAWSPPLSGTAKSLLEVTCRLQGDWSHRAGQYAFLTCDRLEGAHPFTIASADRGCGEVRFSIKALATTPGACRTTWRSAPGSRWEGPYGCFDFRRGRPGGRSGRRRIGVTPFIAWLERCRPRRKARRRWSCTIACAPQEALFAGRLRELLRTLAQRDPCTSAIATSRASRRRRNWAC